MAVVDLIWVGVIVFVFCISAIVGMHLLNEFEDTVGGELVNDASQNAISQTKLTLAGFNYLYVLLLFGLAVGVIVGAFMIRTHPVFFIVSIFILAIVLVFNAQLANAFVDFASTSEIQEAASNFGLMETIWENTGLIFLIIGIVTIIVLYGKYKGGDQFT